MACAVNSTHFVTRPLQVSGGGCIVSHCCFAGVFCVAKSCDSLKPSSRKTLGTTFTPIILLFYSVPSREDLQLSSA